jgi:phosphopantetheinyl transferase (holo-ACP synthase)
MLGNDVVDLDDPESHQRRHPRFDARVFAPSERALIDARPDTDPLRWLLWAAKESAYKALRKADPDTVFAPSRFVVRPERAGRARVDAAGHTVRVEIAVEASCVHAVARGPEDGDAVCCGVDAMATSGTEGDRVRRLAVDGIARAFGLAASELAIGRRGRIPVLCWRGRPSAADLSLSHHGRFVAFACAADPAWSMS